MQLSGARNSNILFLGDAASPLLHWLVDCGEPVIQTSERISEDYIRANNIGFLVSYGYRYILPKNILELFPARAINLHISYLPWNRGADPNFWSFVRGTPKGVTIHYLDEGIDTGDIIAQRKVEFDSGAETLTTSYEKLHSAIQALFKQHWEDIKAGVCRKEKQAGEGSCHRTKDKEPFMILLTDGWNTPVSVLEEHAAKT